eukprot:TRINITY_DN1989_c0_g3_i2.p1 TRINITY_DN1989_c0_g3~~TRINITY_DN1989_c0_g3_i2.p1  ORF type:complete len:145 (+),score=16.52 TRINITY_DN1989_c0_g3_i2:124-558(+)
MSRGSLIVSPLSIRESLSETSFYDKESGEKICHSDLQAPQSVATMNFGCSEKFRIKRRLTFPPLFSDEIERRIDDWLSEKGVITSSPECKQDEFFKASQERVRLLSIGHSNKKISTEAENPNISLKPVQTSSLLARRKLNLVLE